MNVKVFVDSLKGRTVLAENEVKEILLKYGINVPKFYVIKTKEELDKLKLEFPLVMKVCSPEILHKTEVGGVALNIQNKTELYNIFNEMQQKFPNENILVEKMERSGVELIIGLIKDKTFGLTIMFGLGGILTELYKDVVFRVIPISEFDAEQMLTEIKGRRLLEGFRGIKIDRKAVKELLLKMSKLGEDFEHYLDQMDLNPVFAREKDLVVVDAKMVLSARKKEI